MLEPLTDLLVAVIALLWFARSQYWKRRCLAAEGEGPLVSGSEGHLLGYATGMLAVIVMLVAGGAAVARYYGLQDCLVCFGG